MNAAKYARKKIKKCMTIQKSFCYCIYLPFNRKISSCTVVGVYSTTYFALYARKQK